MSKKIFMLIITTLVIIIGVNSLTLKINSTPISKELEQVNKIWYYHQQDEPIAAPLLTVKSEVEVITENVEYGNLNNKPIQGYIARPTHTNKPLPGLIVIHEWWGLNDNIKMMTEKLAGEGYTALAVDLYQGEVADQPEQARKLVTFALKNSEQLKDNLRQAYEYLDKIEKTPKIASIGWCFGGTWSLNTALLFPDQLDAVVIYYGGGITTNQEELQTLEMPILGIFGALDKNPSVETVHKFESVLESLDKTAQIHIYENADHAFANPSGNRYNVKAAEDAWHKTKQFLAQYLSE